MVRPLVFVLLLLYTANAFAGYGGYIGTHDNRRYGSLSEPEYNGVVKLTRNGAIKGTGVFVSKNIILTNNHCVAACINGCQAEFWNGSGYETANMKVLAYNSKAKLSDGTDWGLLLSDKDSDFYKSIASMSTTGPVQRGGYGMLRIINDEEIPFLKNLYAKVIAENQEECKKTSNMIECINRLVEKNLKTLGKKQLFKDVNNFKVQTCNIIGNSPKSKKMVETDCDSSGGDSGAPLLRDNMVVGLNNSGKQEVFGDGNVNATALKTENFYMPAQGLIAKYRYTNGIDLKNKYIDDKEKEESSDSVKPDSVPDDTSDLEEKEFQQMLQNLDCD